jgi:hypothetical protein
MVIDFILKVNARLPATHNQRTSAQRPYLRYTMAANYYCYPTDGPPPPYAPRESVAVMPDQKNVAAKKLPGNCKCISYV